MTLRRNAGLSAITRSWLVNLASLRQSGRYVPYLVLEFRVASRLCGVYFTRTSPS